MWFIYHTAYYGLSHGVTCPEATSQKTKQLLKDTGRQICSHNLLMLDFLQYMRYRTRNASCLKWLYGG